MVDVIVDIMVDVMVDVTIKLIPLYPDSDTISAGPVAVPWL